MDRSQRVNTSGSDDNAFPSIVIDPPAAEQQASSSQSNTITNSNNLTPSRPANPRQRSIRLKRLPSASAVRLTDHASGVSGHSGDETATTGRRRSTSEPQRPLSLATLGPEFPRATHMDTLSEETSNAVHPVSNSAARSGTVGGRLRSASGAARSRLSRRSNSLAPPEDPGHEYDARIVDLLDVVGTQC
jgi:hypothetical protein